MKKNLILLTICGLSVLLSAGAIAESNPFSVSGYGVINYAHFDWELDPDRRAAIGRRTFRHRSKIPYQRYHPP